jgi:asparagine synthase (glutamine-hydrolysing)
VLSGAGGDELFGGYPWRYFQAANSSSFDEYISSYYSYWQRLLSNTELKAVFSPVSDSVSSVWTQDIFRDVFQQRDSNLQTTPDYINHSLYLEAKTFLHGLLVVEDKLSMANSLETRLPFLENELVDFSMRCPVALKVDSLSKTSLVNENDISDKHQFRNNANTNGKKLLRSAMRGTLPAKYVSAEKRGFSAPDSTWFQGNSVAFLEDQLLRANAPLYNYLDRQTVSDLIGQHVAGQKNRRLLVWSFLSVNQWMRGNL